MPARLLDSTALLDWYCGRRGVARYFEEIFEGRSHGAFSTVSELELWQGLRQCSFSWKGFPSIDRSPDGWGSFAER
jgi:hypothetical protein